MKILIKVNKKEPESLYRFYVTKNDKVVKGHLSYEQALQLKEKIKNK